MSLDIQEINKCLPDDYRAIKSIGEGGFGEVFECISIFSFDNIAIKVLDKNSVSQEILSRFEDEIKMQSTLSSNYVVPITDYNLSKDSVIQYYCMPLAEKSLDKWLVDYRNDNVGMMAQSDVEYYFNQILEAVKDIHNEGIVHRDLKPQNILVYPNERIKISDFGLGKYLDRTRIAYTATGTSMGTAAYAAPEQFQEGNARGVDFRADIYSLGKILYELITYDYPMVIDVEKIQSSPYKLIIEKSTQYNPEKRYQTIQDFIADFEMFSNKRNLIPTANYTALFLNALMKYRVTPEDKLLRDMVNYLLTDMENYNLYTTGLIKLDNSLLRILYSKYSIEMKIVIETYLDHVENRQHPFSFTDNITNFLLLVIKYQDDSKIIRRIIATVAQIGYSHNRFYCARKLGEFFESLSGDMQLQYLSIQALNENSHAKIWVGNYVDRNKLPDMIRKAFE